MIEITPRPGGVFLRMRGITADLTTDDARDLRAALSKYLDEIDAYPRVVRVTKYRKGRNGSRAPAAKDWRRVFPFDRYTALRILEQIETGEVVRSMTLDEIVELRRVGFTIEET